MPHRNIIVTGGSTGGLETVRTGSPADLQAASARRDDHAGQGRRQVLIVEDHADTSDMLSMFLSQHGYGVTVARTLAEGLKLLDRDWYAVFSDISLADGSGLDVARHARASGRRPARLVALSGFGSQRDVELSREAGFDAHLIKPVDLDRLLAVLEGSR